MTNQEHPLPPCPECGGPRTWFRLASYQGAGLMIFAGFFSGKNTALYACTCLECGMTTLRPAPGRMPVIRQLAETQKPFKLV
jgi:hypothetical protein